MKKVIIKLLLIIIVFITLTFVSVFFLMNSNRILTPFKIIKVENVYNTFKLSFEKVRAASGYKVELTDTDANLIYTFNTDQTENTFIVDNLEYDMSYSFMVYAYDNSGNILPCLSSYDFVYSYPSIDKSNILLNDSEYILKINGDLSERDYYINISSNNELLIDELINTNEYIIPDNLYKDKSIELNVNIISEGIIIDSINLFNNMNPIKDIYIDTPTNNSSILYNDISLIFNGGDNAEHYNINLYDGKNLIHTSITNKKKVIISRSFFETDKTYTLEVVGVYGEYENKSSVVFDVAGLAKLQPVYININPKAVKAGSKLILKQPEGANIYYTLNGDDPSVNGILYEEPITIDQSCTLKTVAIANLRTNSVVSTYDLNVAEQLQYKFYISPSNQGGNQGVHEVGFTTEKQEMNKIADYLIERLKQEDNVIVYRNNPEGNINQWNNDANYLGVDFKFAIHSNASTNHTAYGIETWVDSEYSQTYSLASLLQDKMVELYPYKDREKYNRGVKYALGEIGEANDNYVKFGILIETAHHDDLLDAKWLKENEKEIGYALAEVILDYYQVS